MFCSALPAPLSAQIAQVQHAPSINGKVDGSLQQMSAEGVTFNGGANVTGDLSVPGTPTIQLNGTPAYSGTLQGSGTSSPSNYTIMLNSGASLRHVIRRTDAVSLPTVGAVAPPTGTTSVTVNSAGQAIAWATLKNLTLNSNAGQHTVPAGTYGSFNAGSGSGFRLGVAGATHAAVYNFQNLTLNGNSTLQILGPVVINLANGVSANAPVGASTNPAWLTLNIKSGGFTLNSGCNFYGYLLAPSGQVIVNAGTQLVGGVVCANLTVNGNGLLKLQSQQSPNQLPVVVLTAPANGVTFAAPGSFTLSATASDPDGTVSKIEFFQGTTKVGEDATAPYNFVVSGLNAGSYSYFARVTDNTGATSDSSTVTVTVTSPNQPPTVSLIAPVNGATFIAPATLTLTASAVDADGTIAHVDFYQGSALIGQGINPPYQISTSTLFAGSYVFSAKAYDNSGAITTASGVTVTIMNPNQPPSVSITSPTAGASYDDLAIFTINASASDPDGSVAKVELFQNGSRVNESLSAPFTFAISGLPVGTYDFVARATDNENSSVDSAPVRITVTHINHGPVARAQTQTTLEDTPVAVTLTGSDLDGDALSYAIVTPPSHGSLVSDATATTFVYTPTQDFNGADSFTFKVSDGSLQSAPATVQLNVTPVNDAPISYPASIGLDENTTTSLKLAATDIDSSALTFSISSGPTHGAISGALPNIIYTPAANYSGTDSLVYKVYDGELFSAPATITITVNHVNRPPIVSFTAPAANASFVSPAVFTLQAASSDSDGTVTNVEFFQDGVKIGETSTAPYQFDVTSLVRGNYSYFARATDDSGAATDSMILPVTVVENIPPTVTLTSPVDGATLTAPATIMISASAVDNDGTIARVDFYQGSTLIGESSSAPFNFSIGVLTAGTYSFSAKAYDNLGATGSTGVATITLINPNEAPSVAITAPVSGAVVAGPATVLLTASASDADGTVTKVEFFNGSEKIGEANTAPYQISWPDVGSGSFTLTARATDNLGATSISLPVTLSVNVPPLANSQAVTTSEDLSTAITLSGSDVETAAGALTYSMIFQPVHGSLTGTAPNLVYTPNANYAGSDSFSFKVNDGVFDSSPATVSITVQAVNHAPVATGPFSLTTAEDTAAAIILTATDAEGSPLTYSIITPPQHGAFSGTAPSLTYIPSANYNGTDRFTFKANDGSLDSAPATVNITITPVNDIPVADSGTFTVTADDSSVVTITGSDVETPAELLVFRITSAPSHGSLSGTAPNLVYTPISGYDGTDSFAFIVNDGTADSLTASVNIAVVGANAAPTVDAGEDKHIMFAPTNGTQPRGRIVVNNDEWALTDQGFSSSPYAGAFARNLADFLTGGKPGAKFLAYTNVISGSVDFIYTGANLAAAMTAAGHTWVTSSTIPMTLANLKQYDAVFIGASTVDNQVLIDYVDGGGSVYLSAGTHWCGCDAEGEAALWNPFLEHFGLHYNSPYNGVGGTLPVFSDHPLFYGIKTLYFANGNSVTRLNPDDPYTTIPFIYSGQGLFGIYGYDLNQVFLHGTATDDGRPNPPAALIYTWTQVAGPFTATLDAPGSLTTRVRFDAAGVYAFRLTADDGSKTSSDEVTVTVNTPPQVYAGPDQSISQLSQTATLAGSVIDDGVSHTPTIVWKSVLGPGPVVFGSENSTTTTATFGAAGRYVLELSADDGLDVRKDYVEVSAALIYPFERPSGMVAWWPGNGTAVDIIGGHNGTLKNGSTYSLGEVSFGFGLDGIDDHVDVTAHPDLNLGASTAGLTIELWAKPGRNQDVPLVLWGTTTTEGVSFRQWNGGVGLYAFLRDTIGNSHTIAAESMFSATAWIHVAVTYDKVTGLTRLYRNGIIVKEENLGIFTPQTTYPLEFGSLVREGRFYQGALDEITFYNRPLSAAEINEIYQAGTTGKAPADGNQPPFVSAGPDIALPNTDAVASLNGNVTDDGHPENSTVFTSWSKVDGPGTVVFGDTVSASTTATFSAPGIYLLRLDANDGLIQGVGGLVTVTVGVTGVKPPSGVAAWWPGNGNPHEVVRGNHDVELLQGAGYGGGRVSQAFSFDGINDFSRIAAHSDLNLGGSTAGLTIELWAKPGRNQDVPLVLWGTTTTEGVSFRQWNGGVGLYAFLADTAGNSHTIAAENMFSANVWIHVAVTYDKVTGLARLYRNGIIVKEQNIGVFAPQTTYPLEFGSLVREGRFYQGALDEITFYSRPLTAAEINAVFQAGAAGKTPPDDNQSPVVSAGPDVVLANTAAIANLNGSATDDNKPFGPPTILWALVDGPGTVIFANASSASTTATFSTPGTYLLKLTASDGYVATVSDLTEVRVGVSTVEPASGIAAWWPGNGNPHEVIHGNHDVEMFQGAGYGAGRVSQAFSFDGINDYSRIAAHSDLNLGASAAGLTIELWAKPSRAQDVPLVLWGTTTGDGVSFRQWNGGVGLYAFLTDTTGNGHVIAAEDMFSTNAWTHVAVTYDKVTGLARLYRNGMVVKEQNLGVFTPQTTYPLEFGSLVREGRFYQGALDEITFYNRPLSAAEINAVYLGGADGKTPPGDNQPPTVSAGPDVTLTNISVPANLNGSVVDDNKPFGPPLIFWTMVDGPGTVIFGNASSAVTTATFGTPGTYLLKLTASDGYVSPVSDLTEVRVGVAAVEPASGIAAWWPGNGNPHEVILGNHDVELLQGAGYGAGRVSQAFSFDGINDYSRVAAHSDLNLGASIAGLTIELWAKPGRNQDVPLVLWGAATREGVSFRQWNGGVGLYAFLADTAGNSHTIAAEDMFSTNV
ncbi:MAG: tandem-95 repeat protein, partial [Lacunisphaera sp.]